MLSWPGFGGTSKAPRVSPHHPLVSSVTNFDETALA